MRCMCDEVLEKASEFLLSNRGKGGDDVHGRLWGYCFECSEYFPESEEDPDVVAKARREFKQQSKKAFERLKDVNHKRAERARSASLATLNEVLKEKYKDESASQIRAKSFEMITMVVMQWVNDIDELDEKERNITSSALTVIHTEWMKDVMTQAENYLFVPQVSLANIGDYHQYLTYVRRSIFVSFACRLPSCRFYGWNHLWLRAAAGNWIFCCPMCLTQYRAHAATTKSGGTKLMPHCKILGVMNPLTMEFKILPATWPAAADEKYLANAAVQFAEQLMRQHEQSLKPMNVRALAQRAAGDLDRLLTKHVNIPIDWKTYTWDKEDQLDKRWSSSNVRNGFCGAILPEELITNTPFNDWEVIIACLGKGIAAARQITSKI